MLTELQIALRRGFIGGQADPMTVIKRLPSRVLSKIKLPETEDSCWEWLGSKDRRGYGRLSATHGRGPARVHRIVWEIANRADAGSLEVCHDRDNPSCVNPNHLFLGTHAQNMADMARKGRASTPKLSGETHPAAKLSWSQVEAIKMNQRPQRAIALAYGVSQGTISRIKSGTGWRR